jgi:hypothetical protein
MVVVNGLANALPLNGRGTGEISALYPNLFVPAGLTFSIWGLIYLLLLGFCVHGLVVAVRAKGRGEPLARVGPLFVVSSLANAGWIFAWHWQKLGLSVALMVVLLASLVAIYLRLDIGRASTDGWTRLLVHVPFAVYLGWITVATIANVTALLVAIEWDGFGIPPVTWTVAVIVVAVAVALTVLATRRDAAYAAVVVWALVGIHLARSAEVGSPASVVAWTALGGAALLALAAVAGRIMSSRRAAPREAPARGAIRVGSGT